ncbi:MAG TPA: hypothetical protein VM223_10175 [Planctomycetota bacterium]|nr:hypothetical protein [Planctomycetota bacterium]
MQRNSTTLIFTTLCFCMLYPLLLAADEPATLPPDAVTIQVATPMAPPDWAVKERLLLQENTRAVQKYVPKYWDKRGWFKCVERWGIADGVDDVQQAVANFPLLYSLGADRSVLDLYCKTFEGHIKQFSRKDIAYAPPWGVYHNELIAANEWFHFAEHYAAFCQAALAEPHNRRFTDLTTRFAGLYLNEGLPRGAEPNYDFEHRVIRSAVTGSLGARLEIEPSFWGHRWEQLYRERPDFANWTNVKGDHPMNLECTTLMSAAYLRTGDERYRRWVLDYVGAWCERAAANGDLFPSNVGLSGKPGEHWNGNWWQHWSGNWRLERGILIGLESATLLSGDPKYLDAQRRQIRALLAHPVEDKGKTYPAASFDGTTWSGTLRPHRDLTRIYLTDFRDDDLKLIEDEIARDGSPVRPSYPTDFFYFAHDYAWLYYLLGRNPDFPLKMLDSDLQRIQQRMAAMAKDESKDWERQTDSTHHINPVSTHSLLNLACGGLGINLSKGTYPILASIWHFDPARNRPGLPDDVAALVDSITKDEVAVQLVNLCQSEPRVLAVRMGAYGEHQCMQVVHGGKPLDVNRNWFAVKLDPGCGTRLALKVKRYANAPSAKLPWEEEEEMKR